MSDLCPVAVAQGSTEDENQLARSDALANAEEETLIYLLERDDLNVKEVGLFEFILNWGRQQVGACVDEVLFRNKLKNLISKIRYTNMDPYEFAKAVVPTGLLSAEESLSVYSFWCADEITRRDLNIEFNTSPRKGEMRAVVAKYLRLYLGTYAEQFPAFSKHSISFTVDRAPIDGKVLTDYLLKKTVITRVAIWMPNVGPPYNENHVLNLNFLIGDYAGPVQAGSLTIRFQKILLHLKKTRRNDVFVEPPLELIAGRTYTIIVENLSTVDLVNGFRMDPGAYFVPANSNLKGEALINFEEACVSLKEIHRKTDYYTQNLPDFSEEMCLIGGVDIGLQ